MPSGLDFKNSGFGVSHFSYGISGFGFEVSGLCGFGLIRELECRFPVLRFRVIVFRRRVLGFRVSGARKTSEKPVLFKSWGVGYRFRVGYRVSDFGSWSLGFLVLRKP